MRHTHADLIHAWADGAQVQIWDLDHWKDEAFPVWFHGAKYRIKPKTVKYRIYLSADTSNNYRIYVADTPEIAERFEQSIHFVRWLTDWIEVEV